MGMASSRSRPLPCGHAFDDVDQDDVGEFLGGDPVSGGRAYVAGAYDGDFLAHE